MGVAGFKAALLGLLCVACTSIAATQATFTGSRWRVTAVNGHSTPANSNYYINFDRTAYHGRIGCNTFEGTYRVTGNRLLPGLTSKTQAACYVTPPPPIEPMTYEAWAFEVVRRPMRLDWRSGHGVMLSNPSGAISLERLP